MQTVHVRVNDAATGQPTPVRIRFTGPDGTYHAPFGRLTEFATGVNEDVGGNLLLGDRKYAFIDGACEIQLPPGPITVEVSKGPEYAPLRQEVLLKLGQLSLRLTLRRWSDVRHEGWYPGDTRCHSLTPHAALLEAAAADLAVVNLLAEECARENRPELTNILAFSGQRPALEMPGHLVVVNTCNRHPTLGSLGLLNCHRVVYPLSFGERGTPDNWSLADWCEQCHRKGGLVVWVTGRGERCLASEALADLILGKVDAFEIDNSPGHPDSPLLRAWYTLLASGLRVPLVGASGKCSNLVPLGCVRTYAHLPSGEPLTYQGWIEAVRAGRTFATNGPLLSFTVDDQGPGGALDLTGPDQRVRVRGEAHSWTPFERLEVVANGTVVATAEATGGPAQARLETEFPLPEGGWLALRCWGKLPVPGSLGGQLVSAHTSPVHVRRAGQARPPDPAAVAELLGHLDSMLDWVRQQARCENDRQREHLAQVFESARQVLLRRGTS